MDNLSSLNFWLFPVISGIVSGLLSSILFYIFLRRLRPKILICDHICENSDDSGKYYGFKVINLSNKYSILDLRAEVYIKTPFNSHGGQNYNITQLSLKKNHIMVVPKFKKNSTEADYAIILTTRDDIDAMWNHRSQLIEINIHAKNSFSGASKTFVKKFYQKSSSVKKGMFTFGKTNEVT